MNYYPPRQSLILVTFGIIIGLLMGGIIWIVASPPRGEPIALITQSSDQLITVHISGEVVKPGVYQIPFGSRVNDVVEIAGGFLSNADLSQVNLAAMVEDSSHLVISPQPSPITLQDGVVNINIASRNELETLPGIGPVFAQNIIDYRLKNGPFMTIDEIQKVSGIGPKTFEKLKNLITVGE